MSKSSAKTIGITIGDPSGIGPEITAKALAVTEINQLANFIIIGDLEIYKKYSEHLPQNCSFFDTKSLPLKELKLGTTNEKSGKAALTYLEKSVELIKAKKINGLVTAPVSKEAITFVKPKFTGHTEFLADSFNVKNVGMLFVADKMRVIIATRHIPLQKVPAAIDQDLIYTTIKLTADALINLFKIGNPTIAVCGLNPHAGEGGKMGKEEIDVIIPAMKKAEKEGIRVLGPFPSDTLFTGDFSKKYDCVVAMYHDQGLIPIKTLCFTKLVNTTIGLPFIRTSPAHGTAFNLAGKNIADATSMAEAIKLVVQLS